MRGLGSLLSLLFILVLCFFLWSKDPLPLPSPSPAENKNRLQKPLPKEKQQKTSSNFDYQLTVKKEEQKEEVANKNLEEEKNPKKENESSEEGVLDEKEARLQKLKKSHDALQTYGGKIKGRPPEGRISSLKVGPTFLIISAKVKSLSQNQMEMLYLLTLDFKRERRETRTREGITLEELEHELEMLLEQYEKLFLAELTPEQRKEFTEYLHREVFVDE